MSGRRWFTLMAGIIVLLITGRMVLRYLDWQASDAAREEATSASP